MRAVVDNADLAALNGASPVAHRPHLAGSSAPSSPSSPASCSRRGTNLEPITLTFFVVGAYGAAVFGRLRSLPLTFAGAIVLGLLQNWGAVRASRTSRTLVRLPRRQQWRRINSPARHLPVPRAARPPRGEADRRARGRPRDACRSRRCRGSLVRPAMFVAAMAVFVKLVPGDDLADPTRALIYGVLLLSLVRAHRLLGPDLARPVRVLRPRRLGHGQGRRRRQHPRDASPPA